MQVFLRIALIIVAYLIGSIPTSVWIGRRFHSIDVREFGSGNAGATNTIRVLGWKAGIPVLIIDMLKGWLAVQLAYLTHFYIPHSDDFITYQLFLGAAAMIGHIFPIYAGFKGGKGVATLFGIILAISPVATVVCMGVFLIIALLTKYVSLGSIVAGFSFPFILILVFQTTTPSLMVFSLIVAILLLFTHQKNIERLLRNKESKATFLMASNRQNRES
ncbi:MAG: glycerol-3-phosphate 1-O-acyltransferase PlsY [Bacteroidales bacterium]|nr:glycerol-3-phosphate 1-O-acyltransferase PlsY [Bacteroidales bacterium]